MSRCRRTIATACALPASVKVTAPYGACSNKPCSDSFLIASDAVDSFTPVLAATVDAVTGSSDHSPRLHTALR